MSDSKSNVVELFPRPPGTGDVVALVNELRDAAWARDKLRTMEAEAALIANLHADAVRKCELLAIVEGRKPRG